jgi:hypothetical protein
VRVSGVWEDLRDAIVNAADAILRRMEKVKHKNWFDEECEQVTNLKTRAYKRMQQKNHTRGRRRNIVKREGTKESA